LVDAGAIESGVPDAGAGDDATTEASAVEAGAIEASVPDTSANDASPSDGASEGGVPCPLPATYCIGTLWQVYYSGGTCQNGLCAFIPHVIRCWADCANGRCGLPPVSE
jgi:hypothetical protein